MKPGSKDSAPDPQEQAHEHDWQIWPETDGLEQRCTRCGEYRRTPEEAKFWLKKDM